MKSIVEEGAENTLCGQCASARVIRGEGVQVEVRCGMQRNRLMTFRVRQCSMFDDKQIQYASWGEQREMEARAWMIVLDDSGVPKLETPTQRRKRLAGQED